MTFSRRAFLAQYGASVVAVNGFARSLTPTGNATTGLREHASAKNIIYGSATASRYLKSTPELQGQFAAECGMLVPEWELQWNNIAPTPDTLNLAGADWLADFAQTNQMYFRGHSLLWHHAIPKWFESTATAQNARDVLAKHIHTVMQHFARKAYCWDVVNEVVSSSPTRPDGLDARAPWLNLIGPEYIDFAFRTAAEADPRTLLVMNQNNLEYDTPAFDRTRGTVLNLLEKLIAKGSPVQAFGIQGHLSIGKYPFSAQKMSRFLSDLASMGLRILITELDVAEDKDRSSSIAERDRKIADEYSRFLAPVLDNKSVIAVLTWGLSDRYSWLSDYAKRSDGQSVRPLPLDANLQRTPAWYALANAFDHAPADRRVFRFNAS